MRFNIFKNLVGLFLVAGILLSACTPASVAVAPQEPTPGPITLTDGLGRSVTLAKPAERIVSMAPSNTEILFALGAGEQVLGRDEFSDFPAEAQTLPTIGGSWGGYNYEAIVGLQPDLVLASDLNTLEQVQSLQDLGLTVFLLSNPTDMEGMYQNLVTVGKLTGQETEAAALVTSLTQRVAAVTGKVGTITDRPIVFYELDATDPNAPYTAGSGTFIDLLIHMAGGRNAAGSMSTPWAQLSTEQILLLNPEIILLGDAAYGITPESVEERAGWDGIAAVQNEQIYAFDDNLTSRPGPRLVEGLEEMARLLHPDLFK